MLTANTPFILALLDRFVPLEATESPSWFQLGRDLQTGQFLNSHCSFSLLFNTGVALSLNKTKVF